MQVGKAPKDAKPIASVGRGVWEIRTRTGGQAHRVFYVAKFEEAIYVLHAFEKKTQKTAPRDVEMGRQRYKELLQERNQRG